MLRSEEDQAFVTGLEVSTGPAKASYSSGDELEHWGDQCYGRWSEWSQCNEQCYRVRGFTLLNDTDCPDSATKQHEQDMKLCSTGNCPFSTVRLYRRSKRFGGKFRQSLFKHGIPSKRTEDLGILIGEAQMLISGAVIIILCVVALVQSLHIEWLPDICVAIPLAAACALFLRFRIFHGINFGLAGNQVIGTAVSRVMNDFLIPISIFEGAYHVQRLNFFSQFFYGLTFACIGTGFSACLIAAMVKWTGAAGLHPVANWRESFAYAAFIADTDPVATLAIFGNLKADALLSTMVAGEATLNDPIALVIFNVCNVRQKVMTFELSDEGLKGATLLGGSIALGGCLGVFFSLLLKVCRVRGRGPLETAYVFLCAYGGFSLGEFVGMSGIIVTLFGGLVQGVYTSRIIEDKVSVDSFLNSAARIADLIMFIIIGSSCFMLDDWPGVKLGLWTILFCFIARAIMIATLVPLVNLVKRARGYEVLDFGRAFMMWHSGLRGGMTIMMALMVDPYWSENQNTLLNATIVTVIGMAYLCGCTGPTFLRLFNVPMNVPQDDGTLYDESSISSMLLNGTHKAIKNVLGCEEVQRGHSYSHRMSAAVS